MSFNASDKYIKQTNLALPHVRRPVSSTTNKVFHQRNPMLQEAGSHTSLQISSLNQRSFPSNQNPTLSRTKRTQTPRSKTLSSTSRTPHDSKKGTKSYGFASGYVKSVRQLPIVNITSPLRSREISHSGMQTDTARQVQTDIARQPAVWNKSFGSAIPDSIDTSHKDNIVDSKSPPAPPPRPINTNRPYAMGNGADPYPSDHEGDIQPEDIDVALPDSQDDSYSADGQIGFTSQMDDHGLNDGYATPFSLNSPAAVHYGPGFSASNGMQLQMPSTYHSPNHEVLTSRTAPTPNRMFHGEIAEDEGATFPGGPARTGGSRSSRPRSDARRRTIVMQGSSRRMPTIAPGSPVERALRSQIMRPRHKLHRPAALKKRMMGTDAYYRVKAEKLQGKIINQQHTLYQLSYGMMVGIYTSVDSVRVETPLMLDDFASTHKLIFPPEGSTNTKPHLLNETFKMKDYAPKVFHYLRERFGIDRSDYLASLGGAYQYIEFQSNSKSGQFFFFSHDGKFMIKTQTKQESRFLRDILVHYFKHSVENEGTYLPRFYGMHRLKMKHLKRKVHFVVMHSVFDSGDLPIHEMYDLKGSRVGRSAKPEEKARGPGKCVLKDNDLVDSQTKIKLGPARRKAFLEQIHRDVQFLKRMHIMDYSLLVGIRYRHRLNQPGVRRQSVMAIQPESATSPYGRFQGLSQSSRGLAGYTNNRAFKVSTAQDTKTHQESISKKYGFARPIASPGMFQNRDIHGRSASARSLKLPYKRNQFQQNNAPIGSPGVVGGGMNSPRTLSNGMNENHHLSTRTTELGMNRTQQSPYTRSYEVTDMNQSSQRHAFSRQANIAVEDNFHSSDLMYFPAPCEAVPGQTSDGRVAEEIYYLGIIDILQKYNMRKTAESMLRGIVHKRSEVSAVGPQLYGDRFEKFMSDHSV